MRSSLYDLTYDEIVERVNSQKSWIHIREYLDKNEDAMPSLWVHPIYGATKFFEQVAYYYAFWLCESLTATDADTRVPAIWKMYVNAYEKWKEVENT